VLPVKNKQFKMTNRRRNLREFLLTVATIIPLMIESRKVTSTLQVHLPKDLNREGGYEHREALFGVPPYGGSIQQIVHYAGDNNLCDGTLSSTSGSSGYNKPFILLVDRGGCTFVQKVRNGQHSGAAAVIIADNVCQCKHSDECPAEKGKCEKREPIMADDGSGNDITIPSLLIFKQDGDVLKQILASNSPLRIEMAWSVPNPDDHVEYDLWTSPVDVTSIRFKTQWKDAAIALKSRVSFTPHMYLYDGMAAKCRSKEGENECYTLCTNVGRYCSIDPDNDLDKGISGANVVEESLRRICISKFDDEGLFYWEYIRQFMECDNGADFMSPDCFNPAMKRAGINVANVQKCMEDSGGLKVPERNKLLQVELNDVESKGVVVVPVAFVNNVPIRGALDFDVVFKAVCAGFKSGTEPSVCLKCANCKGGEHECVVNNRCKSAGGGGISSATFLFSLLVVTALFGILAFIQHRRSKREVRAQVKGILAEYMPLDKQGLGSDDTAIEQDDDAEGEFA